MNRILVFFFVVILLLSNAYCDGNEFEKYQLTLDSIPEDNDIVEISFRNVRMSILYQTAYFNKAKQYDELVDKFKDNVNNFKSAIKYIDGIERRIVMEKYLYPAVFCLGLFCGGYVVAQIQ